MCIVPHQNERRAQVDVPMAGKYPTHDANQSRRGGGDTEVEKERFGKRLRSDSCLRGNVFGVTKRRDPPECDGPWARFFASTVPHYLNPGQAAGLEPSHGAGGGSRDAAAVAARPIGVRYALERAGTRSWVW